MSNDVHSCLLYFQIAPSAIVMQWYVPESDVGEKFINGFLLLGSGSDEDGDEAGFGTLIKVTMQVADVRSVWAGFTQVRLALEKHSEANAEAAPTDEINNMLLQQLKQAARFLRNATSGLATAEDFQTDSLPELQCTAEVISILEGFFEIDCGVMEQHPSVLHWLRAVFS